MYGGPQQGDFATVMTKLGLAKSADINGGSPNAVSFTPNVRHSACSRCDALEFECFD